MHRLLALAICLAIHLGSVEPAAAAARRAPRLASHARATTRVSARHRGPVPRSPRAAETLAAVDDALLGAGQIALAQEILLRAGWLHGTADGRLTIRTRRALAALQRALHRPGTGALDAATYALLVPDAGPERPTAPPATAAGPPGAGAAVSSSASAPPRRSHRRHR